MTNHPPRDIDLESEELDLRLSSPSTSNLCIFVVCNQVGPFYLQSEGDERSLPTSRSSASGVGSASPSTAKKRIAPLP